MPPENNNQTQPQQPPVQSVAASGLQQDAQPLQPPVQFEPLQSRSKRRVIIILLLGVVIIGAIIAGVLAMAASTDDSAKKSDNSAAGTATQKEQIEPLKLTTYDNAEAGFTMMVPEEAKLDGYADDVFKANYTVSGGSRSDTYGNRLITVSKESYGGDLQLPYEEYKSAMIESVQGQVDGANDSEVFEGEAAITYQSNWYAGDYRAHKMVTEESTRNIKKQDSVTTHHRTSYLFVYVSPSTAYAVEVKGRKDDVAFQSVVDKMIDSFRVK